MYIITVSSPKWKTKIRFGLENLKKKKPHFVDKICYF